jgi:hypothetical protein
MSLLSVVVAHPQVSSTEVIALICFFNFIVLLPLGFIGGLSKESVNIFKRGL